MGMNIMINAALRETRGPKTESVIHLQSTRGFMDDLTLTTTTHVQARWMLTALTDVASWARMKFKAAKVQISDHQERQVDRQIHPTNTGRGDPVNHEEPNQVPW